MKINKKMQIYELKTQFHIYQKTLLRKGGQPKDMNAVFNTIIKKENGVNPFLTVMNFKISYKTWLKHSRKNYQDDSSSIDMKRYMVPVDIEELVEYTSEEEEVTITVSDTLAEIQRKATSVFSRQLVRKKSTVNDPSMKFKADHELC